MKCKLSIQEKLKDLRIERGLSLQELSEQTGLSRAALGNYETDDFKEITHKAIVILADFYGVTSDYLLGLTENREQHPFAVDELGLDDETVDMLKSGKLNVRLICEMIKHPEFINFLSDLEIYVDNLAGMQIRNMNTMIEQTSDYYGAAEPPVRCGVSHLSGLTEPLRGITILPVPDQVHRLLSWRYLWMDPYFQYRFCMNRKICDP